MGGQSTVGAYGDANNAYTVEAIINKTIDRLSQRSSVFGGLGWGDDGKERLVQTLELANGDQYDVGNAGVVQIKDIDVGDEYRLTMGKDLKGRLTHGNAPVLPGDYPAFFHDNLRINVMDTPEFPFWGEMERQRFANVITNMDEYTQTLIGEFVAKNIDFKGIQALLCGADEGLLSTANGCLGLQLWNAAAAGTVCSCKNTYVANAGITAWNNTRATFEAAIGAAIYDLADTAACYFDLDEHEKILNLITSTLRFRTVSAFGQQFRAVALADPWLVKRLLQRSSGNTWYTLMKDADIRGMQNHAIDRDQSVIVDKVLYIPCDWLRAFRAIGADNVQPTYGAGITADPQVYIDTADTASCKCAIIYMGAQALLCGRSNAIYQQDDGNRVKSGRVWLTKRDGVHGKGGGYAAHTKIGMKRYELVAWFYDKGPGTTAAA
jgi:hypothetical protein